MTRELPTELFIAWSDDGDDSYLLVYEDLEDADHGQVIGVYELTKTGTLKVKTTRKLVGK